MTLQRIDPHARAWPLYAPAHWRAFERQVAATLPPHTLMGRAGVAIARLALAVAPAASTVWVLCGPGHNGGDGFEAAHHLRRAGRVVTVSFFGSVDGLPPDAAWARQRALAAGAVVHDGRSTTSVAADLIIDALLGLGISRAPSGALAAAIADIVSARQRTGALVLAVDLPSGLDPLTGERAGGPMTGSDATDIVQADHTLALLGPAPGLYTGRGRDQAGEIWLDTLCTEAAACRADSVLPAAPFARLAGGPIVQRSPARRPSDHKGRYGDVLIVGGARGMQGAAVLAARAALAAGAGRVHVSLLDEAADFHDPSRPELMARRWHDVLAEGLLARSTVVCGCGGGEAVRQVLPALLAAAPRLLLDADALNAIAADASLLALLQARAVAGQATVLTPHPLEAARLTGGDSAGIQADRIGAARRLAQRCACVVVLKGSGTVVARPDAPDGTPYPVGINPTGTAALATAGTGDVLAGWTGGSWSAAGAAHGTVEAAFDIAVAAVYRHGQASTGALAPLRAADLVERLHDLG